MREPLEVVGISMSEGTPQQVRTAVPPGVLRFYKTELKRGNTEVSPTLHTVEIRGEKSRVAKGGDKRR